MTSREAFVRQALAESAEVKRLAAQACTEDVVKAAALLCVALRAGRKLLWCGNGGSAADCQHLAAEFVSALDHHRPRRALAAIALTTDTSFLTASANDFGFEKVFARQVEALGQPGDVLVAISTSGNSPNVLAALDQARKQDMRTIVLTGQSGGKASGDIVLRVPSENTQHIQETHITMGHILCALVEQELFDT
jgi:D-sedoheptulose 7-phosphate isomerase